MCLEMTLWDVFPTYVRACKHLMVTEEDGKERDTLETYAALLCFCDTLHRFFFIRHCLTCCTLPSVRHNERSAQPGRLSARCQQVTYIEQMSCDMCDLPGRKDAQTVVLTPHRT